MVGNKRIFAGAQSRSLGCRDSRTMFAGLKEVAQPWIRQGRKITVQWVPSRMGIQGNEKADIEAKKNTPISLQQL